MAVSRALPRNARTSIPFRRHGGFCSGQRAWIEKKKKKTILTRYCCHEAEGRARRKSIPREHNPCRCTSLLFRSLVMIILAPTRTRNMTDGVAYIFGRLQRLISPNLYYKRLCGRRAPPPDRPRVWRGDTFKSVATAPTFAHFFAVSGDRSKLIY